MTPTLSTICVFCGSTSGEDPRYLEAATALGLELVRRDLSLVYGGSQMGLMGRLADAVLGADGTVVGVIPEALTHREVAHRGLSELVVTESMHARKSEMVRRSDAFIAAPGGIGTLEEFFEVLTWAQLGMHRKPCGLLDVRGYWTPVVQLLDHAVKEGFVNRAHRAMVLVDDDPARLLDRMSSYEAPRVPRWIEAAQT